jgi:hypothetical protein
MNWSISVAFNAHFADHWIHITHFVFEIAGQWQAAANELDSITQFASGPLANET